MPLIETLPVGADTAQWTVWGTVARVVVTEPAALSEAAGIVRAELGAVDEACSRFRPDSELRRACRAGRPVKVSPLLAEHPGWLADLGASRPRKRLRRARPDAKIRVGWRTLARAGPREAPRSPRSGAPPRCWKTVAHRRAASLQDL